MKFAFVTCVQVGLSCMEAIYNVNGKLDLIISIPDDKAKKKSGRIYVDKFAKEHHVEVLKSNHINDKICIDTIKRFEIDWLFIIGWSQIASKEVLMAPKHGVIGAHPTLLPQGRGRAAIPWAILKGLKKTGVTFFKMDKGVDTGLILDRVEVPILVDEIATTLYNKINLAHEILIKKLYPNLILNKVKFIKQDNSKATYWGGRTPQGGEIKFDMSIDEVDRLVRATTKPYPGAYIILENKKMIIWKGFISKTIIYNTVNFKLPLSEGLYYASNYEVLDIL